LPCSLRSPQPAIVASTGVFVYEELPGYFRERQPRHGDQVDALAETFIRQLTVGIDGTSIRAGVVKCTTENPSPGPMAQRAIRAAGLAAVETGVPVISHTSAAAGSGPVLAKLLIAEGADPARIAIGHCGDTDDLDYLRGLLDQGLVLGMDRFGHDYLLPHVARLRTVTELCHLGYAEQLVLSMDSPCFIDYYQDRPAGPTDSGPFTTDYTRMTDRIVPGLLEMGVTEAQVTTMLVTNPARFLPRR
jgi:phosphotriesterase-related protein